jgi:hypothetical protein
VQAQNPRKFFLIVITLTLKMAAGHFFLILCFVKYNRLASSLKFASGEIKYYIGIVDTKVQNEAAARARATRLAQIAHQNSPDTPEEDPDYCPIVVDSDSDDDCEYNFETLKENLPKALDSVHIHTIRKWEHRMYRWIEAYRSGLETRDAQALVRKFSSTKYKSHRRIPEAVARAFD